MSRFITIATIAAALALGPALASTTAHAKGNPKNNEQNAMMDLLDLQLLFLEDQRHGKVVFVTSTKPNGNLKDGGGGATGLEGADNICNTRAVAGDLPGTYTAFLSDAFTDARDRVTQSGSRYELVDGTKVADSFADIVNCGNPECLDFSIKRDEFGAIAANSEAWTATATDGTDSGGPNCINWTSASNGDSGEMGTTNATDFKWLLNSGVFGGTRACDVTFVRLYCFQD